MANHRKDNADHVRQGTWRADRHASSSPAVVALPAESNDALLWQMLEQWHQVFDDARECIANDGLVITSAGAQKVPNPACKAMADASTQIRSLCQVLGIGALNRARLGGAGEHEPDDDPENDVELPALPTRGATPTRPRATAKKAPAKRKKPTAKKAAKRAPRTTTS